MTEGRREGHFANIELHRSRAPSELKINYPHTWYNVTEQNMKHLEKYDELLLDGDYLLEIKQIPLLCILNWDGPLSDAY